MALPHRDRNPRKLVPIRKDRNQPDAVPTDADLTRFLERRRAQELGFELPMKTEEAAAYVGYHQKTVERMARMGEIPAHPVSGVRRKTWKFFPSELDAWLRSKVNSRRYPCSPDGKDSVN